MPSRTVLTSLLVAATAVLVPAPPASAASTSTPHATITSAPRQAVEGDRISFSVKVTHPGKAKKVALQERVKDVFGQYEWTNVRAHKVHGKSRHKFAVTSDGPNTEKYRAMVTYGHGRTNASKPVSVKVWRWIPLTDFDSYYATNGISSNYYSQFNMNGQAYKGWFSYGSYRYWEARYTAGRNCRAFHADLGVTDDSQDGSSATISFLTDDGTPLFTSEALTPGMVQKVDIDMNLPYRFWVQATDTSPDGTRSYPAMGAPAFLCTGI